MAADASVVSLQTMDGGAARTAGVEQAAGREDQVQVVCVLQAVRASSYIADVARLHV
jgi:hypothetical protein